MKRRQRREQLDTPYYQYEGNETYEEDITVEPGHVSSRQRGHHFKKITNNDTFV